MLMNTDDHREKAFFEYKEPWYTVYYSSRPYLHITSADSAVLPQMKDLFLQWIAALPVVASAAVERPDECDVSDVAEVHDRKTFWDFCIS